jgi:hypothetical protein
VRPASDEDHREGPRVNLAQERLLELLSYGSSRREGEAHRNAAALMDWMLTPEESRSASA